MKKFLSIIAAAMLACGMLVSQATTSEADQPMDTVYFVYYNPGNGNWSMLTAYRDQNKAQELIDERNAVNPGRYWPDPIPMQLAGTDVLNTDDPNFVVPEPELVS